MAKKAKKLGSLSKLKILRAYNLATDSLTIKSANKTKRKASARPRKKPIPR